MCVFNIVENENGTIGFVEVAWGDAGKTFDELHSAFPNFNAKGMGYWGLHCYGGYENAITFEANLKESQ